MRLRAGAAAVLAALALVLGACSQFGSGVSTVEGNIVGNTYTIDTFDNFGNLVLKTHGKRINIKPNTVTSFAYSDDGWYETEELSSVITINIDGKQMISCGDTCIFYEDGLVPDYNFTVEEINSTSHGLSGTTFLSGIVNEVKNSFGKSVVVLIKSQTGALIYAFSGDEVYWEVPDDLPKFTTLYVDGKRLYIHRANFQIIDRALID